jgi:Flp pilus assembly protein TadG
MLTRLLMRRPARRRPAWRFWRDRRSTAALEFAFIAPVLVVMLLGTFEIANAALVYEEVQNAAHSIPASVSNLAVQGDGSTSLTYAQIQLAASEIWAEIPELRTGFQDGTKSITISSVTFIQQYPVAPPAQQTVQPAKSCTPNSASKTLCTYTPTVVWSVGYTGGDSGRVFGSTVLRSCTGAPNVSPQTNALVEYTSSNGTISYNLLPGGLNNEAPPSANINNASEPRWATSDLTSLPTYNDADPDPYLAAPSPILVVDVHLQYHPIFGLFIKSPGIDFYASGLWPVRSVKTDVTNSNGTLTALTLSEQFTTLTPDSTLSAAPTSSYCVNSSPYLYPAAES